MLELPLKRQRRDPGAAPEPASRAESQWERLDPLRLLNAVAFSTHLKQQEAFTDALQDATRYEEDEFTGEVIRDASKDPRPSSLFRAARRLDAVGMAIDRPAHYHARRISVLRPAEHHQQGYVFPLVSLAPLWPYAAPHEVLHRPHCVLDH